MKRLLLLALLAASPSWAAPIDDALAADAKGDYATELRIVRPLATQGEKWAQYFLASLYANGQGVVQDDAEAAKWYKLAAAQGDAGAQLNLGLMYAKCSQIGLSSCEGKANVAASNAGSSTPESQSISNLGLAQYEKYCIELGFKKKTPEYGSCVLDLSRRAETLTAANVKSSVSVQAQQSQSPDIFPAAPSGDGTADDLSCQGYGYKVGTNEYAGCRLNLRQANEENERRQREYNFEKQRYERQLESSNEAERRRKAKCHFASSAAAGRSGSTTLQAFTNLLACEGGADAPVAVAPSPPPTVHCTFLGNSMTCR